MPVITCDSVEQLVGKRRNRWLPAFSYFLQGLKKLIHSRSFNPLPNKKILDVTKAFAGDKLNIANMKIFPFHGIENTVGKGENAGYQHFLLFPQCFSKPSSLGSL